MIFLKGTRQFEKFFDENVSKVRGILYPIIGTSELDDATQDVFIKIWNSLSTFESKSKLETWLYRISVNTGIDYLRKRRKLETLDDFLEIESENQLKNLTNQDLIRKALQELEEDEIKLIVLHYFEEKTISEIKIILERPEGSIKGELVKARNQLEKIIKKLGGHHE